MKKSAKVFRTRVSVLLNGFILALFIPLFVQSINYQTNETMYILGGSFLFIVLIFAGMRYVISDGMLCLKMWFIPSGSTKISNIVSVERSYNPLSSPAGSLKRLRISFKKGSKYPFMLISPVREKEFIEELKTVNPDINVKIPDKKGMWRFWDWDF